MFTNKDTIYGIFVLACVIVLVLLIIYVFLNKKIHEINKSEFNNKLVLILFVDHIILGLGFVIIITRLMSIQYCSKDFKLIIDSGTDC